MARHLDATTFGVLTKLIDKVTDKHETHQDAAVVQQIKAICKQSDENITWISRALLHRLKEEHSQTRLHVVNLADQLFQRSKAFRNHLTANFTDFLELSLGFRHDKPLPGPANTASQLRDRTLEVVEQWHDKFGSTYKQVSLGYNYLKNNMAMRFPEVRARAAAAAAEAQERQVRSQALLQDKFQHICAGFGGRVTDMKAALTQIAEGFAIIEATGQAPAAAAVPAAAVQDASVLPGPEDEIAWEAVETAAPAADASSSAAAESNVGDEGLSAYAMDTIPEDLLQQAESATSTASEGVDRAVVTVQNPEPAVIETLQGLAKVVSNRHLPRVQGWLKVFVKVDVGEVGSQQHAQREHMLRSSIDLQAQLKQSQQKLEALSQQLAATPSDAQVTSTSAATPKALPQAHHAVASGQANSQDAKKADQSSALMEALFGSDEEDSAVQDHEAKVKSQAGKSAKAELLREETKAVPALSAGTAAVGRQQGTQQTVAKADQGVSHAAAADARPNDSNLRAQHSAGADPGPSQQIQLDPAAPKRSISFSNSLRRRPASFIQQRRDAFDEAADAAVSQALAQRSMATTQAAGLASQPLSQAAEAEQESPASALVTPVITSEKQNHGMNVPQPKQALKTHTNAQTNASVLDQATHMMRGPVTQGPEGLPTGRVQSAGSAMTKQSKGTEAQDALKVITRTSQAEAAPKLRTGSRLAASMAKMAASKRGGNEQQEAVAAAPVEQHEDVQKKSAIPEDVKRALLAKAPVVAHGHDLVYWDSNNARALVNARGMEYQNHWGAHDPDVELPSEQLNAFFGTRAEYWTPSAKPSALRGQPQQQPPGQGKQPAGSPPGIPGHQAGSSERQTSVPTAAIQGSSVVGNERAQRAADRAHNEAVIASTDQQVAQALADEEAQAAVKASSGQGRGTKRKPPPTVRERLAKKLLSGRARGQTLGEVESVADERFQEVNSNRWQATRFP